MRLHAHVNKIPGTSRVSRGNQTGPRSSSQDPGIVSPPRNKEELQSFLGFANYYRDFVPFHAAKVQPMQELLEKKTNNSTEKKNIKKPLTR